MDFKSLCCRPMYCNRGHHRNQPHLVTKASREWVMLDSPGAEMLQTNKQVVLLVSTCVNMIN